METRANHLWVGAVTLALLAMLAAGIVWLARLNETSREEYTIFFEQSVEGLVNGSTVTYSGVPVGQVTEISLAPTQGQEKDRVRVEIEIDEKVRIFTDTFAELRGSLTGVSTIQLGRVTDENPEMARTARLVERKPNGEMPPIPAREGGIGAILASVPDILDKVDTTVGQLNKLMADDNQDRIMGLIDNTSQLTRDLSGGVNDTVPALRSTLAQMQGTLAEAETSLAQFETVMASADRLMNEEGVALSKQLRATLGKASTAADSLSTTLAQADPALEQLNSSTLPAANATLRDLQSTSRALRQVTERLENEGATSLIGTPPLPDYEP
ncbi:MlaD family protein [Qipengyuania sp. DSG2-2]|uniref:MlaD family protein n=1 Tax=Qipengyuania sp. DGS2-2 TaxID=3349631 RepID=UPI0036D2D0A7